MRRDVADYELIERASDVESLAQELLQESVVAFDTEADSFYHYFDKTCLVQIATRQQIYLLDPLRDDGHDMLAPLGPVFDSPSVRTIFHAAEYDLFVLKRDCRFNFANLFDTMISAQLLGYGAIGLAALAERHFDVRLPKDEQRSDWSMRPLRESQLGYAAADVAYLIPLAERLERELEQASRLEWAKEEFELLTKREWPEREFDELGYLKIKGARKLDSDALAVLRELYWVRDKRARDLDRPPFKVLGNRTLLELAAAKPDRPETLSEIKGITDLIVRRFGRDILAAVQRGVKKTHGPIPKTTSATPRRRMDRRAERRVATLKRWRTDRSKELRMDPGVLCPNSSLEAIAIAHPKDVERLDDIPELKHWFRVNFGTEVVALFAEESADTTG